MIMSTLTELLAFRLLLVLRTGVGVLGGVSSVRSIRSSSESSDITRDVLFAVIIRMI